ncbi:MAG: UMP kinase [archaeon]|nr:UMP kinase [archaeon]
MDKVVVSIGGSVLIPGKEDSIYIKALANMLKEVSNEVYLIVVCGGGQVARYYSDVGKNLGGSIKQIDELCIEVTKINAGLLSIALGENGLRSIHTNIENCINMTSVGKVSIMGGTESGHTTDAVAAMIAKKYKANRIINASNVNAIYSDDPKKNPNAKRYSEMTIDELSMIIYNEHAPCKSSIFDPLGVKIIRDSKIDLTVVNGRNLKELKNAILGKEIEGTHVRPN